KANFLTMKQLGDLMGFSHNYVAKIEKGLATPSNEQIVQLASILEMDADYIMLSYNRIPPKIAQILLENPFIIELLKDPKFINRLYESY
ncbi:helix-turn-helix domain-containing protein, partial [Priestia aryabhattai]